MGVNIEKPGVYLTLGGDLAYIMFTNIGSLERFPAKGFVKVRGTSGYIFAEWARNGFYADTDLEHKNNLIRFLQEFS